MDHETWRDGHKGAYNYGFLCGVDSSGQCRIAHGHQPGSYNDLSAFYASDLYRNTEHYLGYAKMLVDCIFSRAETFGDSPFITPICYMDRPLTVAESRYNVIQAWDRSIVEHYFGRMKKYFPFIDRFTLATSAINYTFRSAVILTNILIQYSPLRSNLSLN